LSNNSVTIAIVYYDRNKEKYFLKSVFSALSQLYTNYQVVVYIDSDKSNFMPNKAIRTITIPQNIRNKPVKIREYIVNTCDSEYLAFWDSDDVYTVDRLSKQITTMNQLKSDYVFSNYGYIDRNNKIIDGNNFAQIEYSQRDINILDENVAGLGISTFRTQMIRSITPFPEVDRLDWWILLRCKQEGIQYCDTGRKILGYYRVYESSLSNLSTNIKISDIIAEINSKIKIYSSLQQTQEIKDRIVFYENALTDDQYLKDRQLIKPKNLWGGLSEYRSK
jgi:hypothetical protein